MKPNHHVRGCCCCGGDVGSEEVAVVDEEGDGEVISM